MSVVMKWITLEEAQIAVNRRAVKIMRILTLSISVLVLSALPGAQTVDPSTLPLLRANGLQHIGAFRVPDAIEDGDYSYGGRILAFNPATNTLFLSSNQGTVAEISIPTPVQSADVMALPFAKFVQPFVDPTDGNKGVLDALGGSSLYGLLVQGNRLTGTYGIYYDALNTQRVTHFSRSVQLSKPSFSGWSQVWEDRKAGFVAGMMTAVPTEWQARLGGPALTGQCCIPIAGRTSQGPAAFSFDPARIGDPLVAANPLLYYPLDHATLGPWSGSNPTFGATTEIRGMVVIAGTRTALYFGRNGTGPYCYGNGTADKSLVGTIGSDGEQWCYDPVDGGKSQHAYPYQYQMWAYDLNDLAAVKAGSKQPWDVVPYDVWPLTLPTEQSYFAIGGVAYDSQRQLIYLSQPGADQVGNLASAPVIHAIKVNSPGTTPIARR